MSDEQKELPPPAEEKQAVPPIPASQIIFSHESWLKMRRPCAEVDREIGGFCITNPQDPFMVDSVHLIKHESTAGSIEFDDEDMNDFLGKKCTEEGFTHDRCGRIWWHTHPGDSAEPSAVDWQFLKEHFEPFDWAIMFIMAKGGETKAILRVKTMQENHATSMQQTFWVDKPLDVLVEGKRGQIEINQIGMAKLALLPLADWKKELEEKSFAKNWGKQNNLPGVVIGGKVGGRKKAKKKGQFFLPGLGEKALDEIGEHKIYLWKSRAELMCFHIYDPDASSKNRPDGSWQLWGGPLNNGGKTGEPKIPIEYWCWFKHITPTDALDINSLEYYDLTWCNSKQMYFISAKTIRRIRANDAKPSAISDTPDAILHPMIYKNSHFVDGHWTNITPDKLISEYNMAVDTKFCWFNLNSMILRKEWDELEDMLEEADLYCEMRRDEQTAKDAKSAQEQAQSLINEMYNGE